MTQEELRKRFGAQLRMLRRRCSLSLEALEDRSGISARRLSAIGAGAVRRLPAAVRASDSFEEQIGAAHRLVAVGIVDLELSFAAELLRFSFSSDGAEDLESCLNRCMALLRQFADLPAGVPDGSADREN